MGRINGGILLQEQVLPVEELENLGRKQDNEFENLIPLLREL